MKKLLPVFAILCSLVGGLMFTTDTYASCTSHFLGLPAWYDNLTDSSCNIEAPPQDEAGLSAYIWTIVVNITSLVLSVVGYLAVGFVVYGGFQYLLSSGDPGRAAKGRKTITNALVGTVICVVASTVMSTISGIITEARGKGTAGDFFKSVFNHALTWGGILCVVMIVIAGIEYAISIGNPGKIAKAKNTILYSAIGLIIIILAAAIVNFVLEAL